MDAREAVTRVLHDAGTDLHWTVIQDRALQAGYVDPFTEPDVKGTVLRALAEEVKNGQIEKTSTGTYRFAARADEQ